MIRSFRAPLFAAPPALLAAAALLLALSAAAATQAPQLESSHVAHLEWRNVGPGGVGGRIVDFAVDPADSDTIYVGTAYSGAWKSVNGGITFEPVFERENRAAVGGIAVAPSNSNVVWIGSGEANGRNLVSTSWGDGVYKSQDGGKTWTNMGLPLSQQIGRIRIHPEEENIVWVSVVGSLWHDSPEHNAARGLWRTEDGGRNWTKILSAGEHAGIVDLEIDPRDPTLMYAAAWQRERRDWSWLPRGDESGLFRSTDAGATWERLAAGLPQADVGRVGVSVCRSRPDTVYTIFEGPEGGVFRSDDRGASWERVNEQVGGSQYYAQIRCDPNDPERVYAPQTQFMVSHDGGRTFRNEMAGKPVHVDHHALWIDPADSDRLVLGNDGGVYLSRDRGDSWHFVRMPITQYYEIGVGMQEPFYYVCGGTQDNNSHCAPSATRNVAGIVDDDWFVTTGGDGFYTLTDPTDPTIVYTESQNGGLVRLDTRTGERKRIKPVDPRDLRPADDSSPDDQGGDESGDESADNADAGEIDEFRWNWSAPLVISRWDPRTIYFGAQVLLRSPDRGDTWEIASPDLTRALVYDSPMNDFGTLRVIAESPLQRGVIAVGTDDGLVQVTEDGGATWSITEAMPGVPEMALVRRLVLSAHDARTLYVASSAHEYNDFAPYVMKSVDLGRTWTSIAGNLPADSPVRAFAEHPDEPDLLFVGTEHDVWMSVDGGGRWVSIKNNLPTVSTHDMLVHPRDNDLVIGTHGRGIWILDNINSLQGLAGDALSRTAHVFPTRPTLQFQRFNRGRNNRGTTYFRAPNPPNGVIIDYWLAPDAAGEAAPTLTIHDANGAFVRSLDLRERDGGAGLDRIVWDMRAEPTWIAPASSGSGGAFAGGGTIESPRVLPGRYEARLRVGGVQATAPIEILADPLVEITAADRLYRHDLLVSLSKILATQRATSSTARLLESVIEQAGETVERDRARRELPGDLVARVARVADGIERVLTDLGRVSQSAGQVYRAVQASTSPPTREQIILSERAYEQLGPLIEEIEHIIGEEMPLISGGLDGFEAPWTMGRSLTLPETARPPRRR